MIPRGPALIPCHRQRQHAIRVVQRRDTKRLFPPIRALHQGTPDRRPQPRRPQQLPTVGVRHGAQVEEVADELVECDLDLRLPELVRILESLHLEPYDVGPPVECRPGAAGDGAGGARQPPVFCAVSKSIPGRHCVSGQFNLDDTVYNIASGECSEPRRAQYALDLGQCQQCDKCVVQNGEHP